MADPFINQTIGGCTILDVVGQGGMGVIYKGRQKSLDRVVAVKVLAPHLANDINFVTRFQKEARAIARVNHPNILAVYDVGTDQNINFMIMELIEGESLAELQSERRGALDWHEATDFIRQAAQGLEAAHAAGIIHRDIKPENLMATRKGQIKVSDFGLAKESDGTGTQTSIDSVMGTPAFMSPEQCDGKKVDGRTDIYSLGGTWYRLITGRLPFEAETAMSTMYRHKHEALIPPNEVLPTIPRPISDVIVKMMAKKREHRHQNFVELIEAIDAAAKKSEELDAGVRYESMGPGMQGGSGDSGPVYDEGPRPRTSVHSRFNSGGTEFSRLAQHAGGQGTGTNIRRNSGGRMGGGGFTPSHDPARFNSVLSEGLPGVGQQAMPGGNPVAAMDEGYANVSRGDELMERGDRINALKAYMLALNSHTLDNSTRARVEQEVQHEIVTRRQNADSLLKRGMLVDAQRECRVIAELEPNDDAVRALLKDIESRLALKRTLVNDIRNAIAASQFENAIKIWDGTPPELRDEGLGKQIEQLRMTVVPAAKLAEQGESFSQQGRLEEAIATFEDALKINPSCEQARLGLKDAESKLQRIEFLLKEGYQYNLEQNYAKAIETWKPILNLQPGHPQALKSIVEAYIQNGQTLRSQGDLDGALALYRGARDADPTNRTVSRMTDEITLLRDKEKQLLDRAQDAMSKGRLGEAIHCWKDIYGLNPANRKAQQMIAQIAKRRQGNAALTFVLVILLTAGGLFAYQYFRERSLIEDINTKVANHEFAKAADIVAQNSFLFNSAKARRLKDDADDEREIQDAEKLADTDLKAGSTAYRNFAERIQARKPQRAQDLLRLALGALSKLYLGEARENLKQFKWDEAMAQYALLANEMKQIKVDHTEELADAEKEMNAGNFMAQQLYDADKQQQSGNAEKAYPLYELARKYALDLGSTSTMEYIDNKVKKEMQFDPKRHEESMQKGLALLEKPTPDLEAAAKAFVEALNNKPRDHDALMYTAYINDLKYCDRGNQAMYSAQRPSVANAKQFTWTADDRKTAFCIDRYEYPNIQGTLPMVDVPFIVAMQECEKSGKKLCTPLRWTDACKGANLANQYPYGSGSSSDAAACNSDSEALLPAGSKSQCHNSIGVFDMSGNAAEWTAGSGDDGPKPVIKGGSFRDKAGPDSNCTNEFTERQDFKAPFVGFRCCRDLEGKK